MKECDSTVHTAVEVRWKKSHFINTLCISILLMLFTPTSVDAGIACLSNPCVNGVCIDDYNSTYSCYCIDGFTGIQCQTNWDECWSSPCENGGICIDGIAEYNCSCPEGFTGTDCEVDFDECDSNPCQNNGTCVDEANQFACVCLPGYSGLFCEFDMAVCNSTEETRCLNGGLCIDGPGMSFVCKCTPGWQGVLCDKKIDECASSPCQNGGVCIDYHADYTCACTFGYTGRNCESEIELCTDNPCTNNALCMMENTLWRCYCVPDYHGEKCQYQYDECLLGPKCMNGGTCIDGVDNFTCSCPPMLTGFLCECLILDDGELDCQYISPTPISMLTTESMTSVSESTIFSYIETTAINDISSTEMSTTYSYETSEITSQTNVPTTLWDQSTHLTTDDISTTIESISAREIDGETTDVFSTSPDYTSSFKTTDEYMTHSTTFGHEKTSTDEYTTTSILMTEFTTELKTDNKTTFNLLVSDESSTSDSTTHYDETTHHFTYSTPVSIDESTAVHTDGITTVDTVDKISTTEMDLTTIVTTNVVDEITSTESLFSTTYPFDTKMTTETETTSMSTESSYSTSTETEECEAINCLNGGTCVLSSEGAKCVCKFDYDGSNCEDMIGIATAAFSGDSYLTHKLYNMTGMKIQIRIRTLSTEGLILYSNIGPDTYMFLYMRKGLLKFKFSCGYQTMLLSELEMSINNGYELKIRAVLELTDNKRHCNASLHLNNTLAMSGGQLASRSLNVPHNKDSWLHLGAIPEGFDVANHGSSDIEPFTGCMFGLRVDEKPRHIFKDATDGFEIRECSSLACLSNPCSNGGSCNDIGDKWTCNCANGYLGKHCEQSVCAVNPCQFGGTCAEHPGSGFLCLCPLGKHGLYCEHNLEIAQPSFSAMVGGLASFAVYQLSKNLVTNSMEMQFRIQPNNMDQISLLAFLGQGGPHDLKSDHLAVTFVKGYIMLTWNLGNGPRRIFTSRPINTRSNKPHLIKIGRLGRTAWLAVDNMQNITGNAPGNLLNLDVLPFLYLGGHDSANFSLLPHDLPLHGGFSGCIWDLWIGNIGTRNNGGVSWSPIRGRAVGQCSVTQCHPMICHNSGACLHHAATYSCLCPEGWFGPLCTSQNNPCDSTNHKCKSASTCIPTVTGYQCDCPLGKAGENCENNVDFSDVSLSGTRSYIKMKAMILGDVHFNLEFEVRPMHPKGLLFYVETHDGCFISLSLQGGLLEYRWTGNEWGMKATPNQITTIVRSGVVMSLGSWHSVRAGRYGRKLYLWVEGTMTTEIIATHQFFTTFNTSIYIGGVKDLSTLPADVMSGHPMSFTGCVRKLTINSKRFLLNKDNILESRNADDCDGDICGGDVCWNGGTCVIAQEHSLNVAKCVCQVPYTGPHCMQTVPCSIDGCNKGKCVEGLCVCPNGWEGYACQNQIKINTPQFSGNSYMILDDNKLRSLEKQSKSNKIRFKRNPNYIAINFTTANPDGLLLWGEMHNNKYISVGLEGGYLKISWILPRRVVLMNKTKPTMDDRRMFKQIQDTEIIKLLQAGKLSNGEWHVFQFNYQSGNVTIVIDNRIVYEENGLGYDASNNELTTYLGGFPNNVSTMRYTNGLFQSNFVGCVSEVSVGTDRFSITNFSQFESENVETCKLFS